jgi:hypothetical protein
MTIGAVQRCARESPGASSRFSSRPWNLHSRLLARDERAVVSERCSRLGGRTRCSPHRERSSSIHWPGMLQPGHTSLDRHQPQLSAAAAGGLEAQLLGTATLSLNGVGQES